MLLLVHVLGCQRLSPLAPLAGRVVQVKLAGRRAGRGVRLVLGRLVRLLVRRLRYAGYRVSTAYGTVASDTDAERYLPE